MTRKKFEEVVFDRYGVRADYPFKDDYETAVFRHGNGKWFAIAMKVSEKRLGKDGEGRIDLVNFKCAPEVIETLVATETGIYPAYHMNKLHWLTVALEECDEATVSWLLGISRELTEKKQRKHKEKRL